jgi:hypothetical protein
MREHQNSRKGITLSGMEGHLPLPFREAVSKDVQIAVISTELKIAMVGGKPAVDDLHHLDLTRVQKKASGRLFAAIPGKTFNPHRLWNYS